MRWLTNCAGSGICAAAESKLSVDKFPVDKDAPVVIRWGHLAERRKESSSTKRNKSGILWGAAPNAFGW